MLKKLWLTLAVLFICVFIPAGCGGSAAPNSSESPLSSGESSVLPSDINGSAMKVKYDQPYASGRLKNSYSAAGSRTCGNISLSYEGYLPKFSSEIPLAGAGSIERYYENMAGYMELLRNEFLSQTPVQADTPRIYYDYSDYRVDFIGEMYMAITRYNERYTGGAHPSHNFEADNFNMKTGRILSMSDLFGDDESAYTPKLNDLIYTQLKKHPAFPTLFPEIKKEELLTHVDNNTFVLTNDGIGFIFNEYELAPYSSVTINIVVPYSALDGLLKIDIFEKI